MLITDLCSSVGSQLFVAIITMQEGQLPIRRFAIVIGQKDVNAS